VDRGEEDNQAWTQLLLARHAFDSAAMVSDDRRRLALEELLIGKAAIGAGGTGRNTIPPTAWNSTSSIAATWPTSTVF